MQSENGSKMADKPRIVIIGGGLAGASFVYHLSSKKIGSSFEIFLIERRPPIGEIDNYGIINSLFGGSSRRNATPPLCRVICKHTEQWIPEILEHSDREVFPWEVGPIQYSSPNEKTDLNPQKEMHQRIGLILDENVSRKKLIEYAEERGVSVLYGCSVNDIRKKDGKHIIGATLRTDDIDNKEYKAQILRLLDEKGVQSEKKNDYIDLSIEADLVVLATGSDAPALNEMLGFPLKIILNNLSATFYIPEEYIEKDIPMVYMYHRHRKISRDGPLVLLKGKNYINFHYLSSEPIDVMEEKMIRILRNYKFIAPFLKHAYPNPAKITPSYLIKSKMTKGALPKFTGDGVALLGAAAGLVTDYYFEGTLGAFASSKILAEVIQSQIAMKDAGAGHSGGDESHDIGSGSEWIFSSKVLEEYERRVRNSILGNWEKSQKASEALFLKTGDDQFDIWDAYLRAMNSDKKVRINVMTAWIFENLARYPLKNDEYSGEKIYMNLPFSKKITLAPLFLKLKFTG